MVTASNARATANELAALDSDVPMTSFDLALQALSLTAAEARDPDARRRARRRAALLHHPDRCHGNPRAGPRFVRAEQAADLLERCNGVRPPPVMQYVQQNLRHRQPDFAFNMYPTVEQVVPILLTFAAWQEVGLQQRGNTCVYADVEQLSKIVCGSAAWQVVGHVVPFVGRRLVERVSVLARSGLPRGLYVVGSAIWKVIMAFVRIGFLYLDVVYGW